MVGDEALPEQKIKLEDLPAKSKRNTHVTEQTVTNI